MYLFVQVKQLVHRNEGEVIRSRLLLVEGFEYRYEPHLQKKIRTRGLSQKWGH